MYSSGVRQCLCVRAIFVLCCCDWYYRRSACLEFPCTVAVYIAVLWNFDDVVVVFRISGVLSSREIFENYARVEHRLLIVVEPTCIFNFAGVSCIEFCKGIFAWCQTVFLIGLGVCDSNMLF